MKLDAACVRRFEKYKNEFKTVMNTGANVHHVSFGDSTFINAYHLVCFLSVSKIVSLRMSNVLSLGTENEIPKTDKMSTNECGLLYSQRIVEQLKRIVSIGSVVANTTLEPIGFCLRLSLRDWTNNKRKTLVFQAS